MQLAAETEEQKCGEEKQKLEGEISKCQESSTRQLQQSVETEQQKCGGEKQKLEGEITKLNELIKQLEDDLQTRQRNIDEQVTAYKLLQQIQEQQQQQIQQQKTEITTLRQQNNQTGRSSRQPGGLPPKPESGSLSTDVSGPQQEDRRKEEDWRPPAGRRSNDTELSSSQIRSQVNVEGQQGLPREQAGQSSLHVPQQEISDKADRGGPAQGPSSSVQSRVPEEQEPSLQHLSNMNVTPPRQQQMVDTKHNPEEVTHSSVSDDEHHLSSEPGSQPVLPKVNSSSLFHWRMTPHRQSFSSDDTGKQLQSGRPGEAEVLKRDERSAERKAEVNRTDTQDQQHAAVM